jgi:serine/threonine-protein kinase
MADTAQFPPGAMLDDKYRIDQLISVGGMGAVYMGAHTLLKKRVAIKVLRTELAGALNMVERFQREAVAASQIGHDNIVSVTDMGTTPAGVAFLVMELLEGRSLAQAIKDEAPMSTEQVADIAHGILAGLGAAHAAGIVHRDMKPENIFLAARPGGREVVKILDFGISSIGTAVNPEPRLTITGIVMGTPNYMSPEQARGDRDIGGPADIYSLGVILYEMLSGQIPYEAENYNLLMHRVLSGEHVKLRIRRPDLSKELEAIVDRAMALSPRDRYTTAAELDQALAVYRSDGGQGAAAAAEGVPRMTQRKIVVHSSSEAAAATAQTMMAESAALPIAVKKSRKGLYALIAAVVIGGGAMAAVMAVTGKKHDDAPKAQAQPPQPQPQAQQQPQPQPQAQPQPQPQAQPVVLEFSVTPENARISVDGKLIDGKKLETPSGPPVAVHIEADGYDPYDQKVPADRSSNLVVKLDRAKPATTPRVIRQVPRVVKPVDKPVDDGKQQTKIITDNPYGH